ncbi:hypothetical protein [Nannocystis pusilla]|uniref:hypothetical protein n=1 Tax=Nannocystis pusilla TaxID=889268 RepID=UPI003B79EDB3
MTEKLSLSCFRIDLARKLQILVPLLALSAPACDDMDDVSHDAELEAVADEGALELVAEAEEAEEAEDAEASQAPGLGPDELQAAPSDPLAAKHSMCCEIVYGDPFEVYARIVNPGPTFLTDCSDIFAGSHTIQYKVNHYYGSPAPFTGSTAPIPLGTTRVIPLSHPGSLGALSCEAWWEN